MVKRKKEEKKEEKKDEKKKTLEKYFYAVGRRKTSVAQVKIFPNGKGNEGDILVNRIKAKEYFPGSSLQNTLLAPLKVAGDANFKVIVAVKGGGFRGQAEAVRLGMARALVLFNKDLKKQLKDSGFLTRDSRKVERKKPGLKKARKAPQWAKR